MNNYISVNIVAYSLLLAKSIQDNGCKTMTDVYQLKMQYGVDVASSLDFIFQCKWMLKENGKVIFTDDGVKVIEMFENDTITNRLWRIILQGYIVSCSPAWANKIVYGRKEAYLFMNEEEQRCFDEAGLIDSYDEETIEWWDRLARIRRGEQDLLKLDEGRIGERLTIKYEHGRTGVKPEWRAVDTNIVGYDILSRRSKDDEAIILIEVKTSIKCIQHAYAIISRHEWEIANLKNNQERYFFYLWSLNKNDTKLAIISVKEMQKAIPTDNDGIWLSAEIPFRIFKDCFMEMSGIGL